jgi:uncharacterized protein (DUF1330 family)
MFVAQSYAQQQSKPAVFFVAETDVGNPELYAKEYAPRAVAIVKKYGVTFIATGGMGGSPTAGGNKLTPLDDDTRAVTPQNRRMVIEGFPDLDQVKEFRADPDYETLRQKAIAGGWVKQFRLYAIDAAAPAAN